jgi:hypothetical protein
LEQFTVSDLDQPVSAPPRKRQRMILKHRRPLAMPFPFEVLLRDLEQFSYRENAWQLFPPFSPDAVSPFLSGA